MFIDQTSLFSMQPGKSIKLILANINFREFKHKNKTTRRFWIQGLLQNTKLCRTENRYFEGLSKMNEK